MASFLEARSRCMDMQEVNATFCKIVDPKPGECILEVGCGSGILCRQMTPNIQPNGHMVGLDISPHFLLEAKKYILQEDAGKYITFECGAGESLPYSSAVFDGAFAARLLLHAQDPDAIVREMVRVVKPGGQIVVMDWDFGSVVVDHPERELTRRLLHWRCDHHGGDNWSGRQLWRRMVVAGLQCLSVHPVITVVHSETDGLTQSLLRAAQVSRDGGAISTDEFNTWVNKLKERFQEKTFFASIVYFIVKGIVA